VKKQGNACGAKGTWVESPFNKKRQEPGESSHHGVGKLMTTTTKWERIARLSKQEPKRTFINLMYLFNEANLAECFHMLDGKKAVGIDGITKRQYGEKLNTSALLTV
jgi:hypothetical protein